MQPKNFYAYQPYSAPAPSRALRFGETSVRHAITTPDEILNSLEEIPVISNNLDHAFPPDDMFWDYLRNGIRQVAEFGTNSEMKTKAAVLALFLLKGETLPEISRSLGIADVSPLLTNGLRILSNKLLRKHIQVSSQLTRDLKAAIKREIPAWPLIGKVGEFSLVEFPSLEAAQARFSTCGPIQGDVAFELERTASQYWRQSEQGFSDRFLPLINRGTLLLLTGKTGYDNISAFNAYRDAIWIMINNLRKGKAAEAASRAESQIIKAIKSDSPREKVEQCVNTIQELMGHFKSDRQQCAVTIGEDDPGLELPLLACQPAPDHNW